MYIPYNDKQSALTFEGSIKSDNSFATVPVVLFSGVAPTSIASVPFDFNDYIAIQQNMVGIAYSSFSIDHAKSEFTIDNTDNSSNAMLGVRSDHEAEGYFTLPFAWSNKDDQGSEIGEQGSAYSSYAAVNNAKMQHLLYQGSTIYGLYNNANFVCDFGQDRTVERIDINTTNPYILLDYWDGSAWQPVPTKSVARDYGANFQPVVGKDSDRFIGNKHICYLETPVTTSKIRMKDSYGYAAVKYMYNLNFYTKADLSVERDTNIEVTWGIILPIYSRYLDSYNPDVKCHIIGDVSDLNGDGAIKLLNTSLNASSSAPLLEKTVIKFNKY